jgi:cytochrome c oxidase subunit II
MSDPTPLAYLSAGGPRAAQIVPLTWFTLAVSLAVCVIIAALLWVAARRARSRGGAAETSAVTVVAGPAGTRWISTGLLISSVPLLVALVWTMVTLAATSGPPRNPGLVLDVTGHQWWWEVTYSGATPADTFSTANEIHVPTGQRVLVRLHGADVIHSFWVPKLTGKTDTIPGQTNLAWLEASAPGSYLGQCTEYCGLQHAHMGLEVVAQSPGDFERWRAAQLQPAAAPQDDSQRRGRDLVEYRCGLCHQVRGTSAGARAAPDLTHLAGRRTLAAGLLPNNSGTLSGWIENSQGLKPGNLMPNQNLDGQQLSDVVSYLEMLQ